MDQKIQTFELQLFLPYLLNQAAEAVGAEFQKIYKIKYGLLRTDWRVLVHLGVDHRLTAKEISEKSNTHKTKVSRAVSRLEGFGYLTRERSQQDRRWEFLELTSSGKTLFEDLKVHAQEYEAKLRDRLSPAEMKMLHEILPKLLA